MYSKKVVSSPIPLPWGEILERGKLEQAVWDFLKPLVLSKEKVEQEIIPPLQALPLDCIQPHEKIRAHDVSTVSHRMQRQGIFNTPVIIGFSDVSDWLIHLLTDGNHRFNALVGKEFHSILSLVFDYYQDAFFLAPWIRRRCLTPLERHGKETSKRLFQRTFRELGFLPLEEAGLNGNGAQIFLSFPDEEPEGWVYLNQTLREEGMEDPLIHREHRLKMYSLLERVEEALGFVGEKEDYYATPLSTGLSSGVELIPPQLEKKDVMEAGRFVHILGRTKIGERDVVVFPPKSTRHSPPFRLFGLSFPLEQLRKKGESPKGLTDLARSIVLENQVIEIPSCEITQRLAAWHHEPGSPAWECLVGSFSRREGYEEKIYLVFPPLQTLTVDELQRLCKIFS